MIPAIADPLGLAVGVSVALLFIGMVFAGIRLVRGPSLADRVVALDFVAVGLIAITALLAVQTGHPAFLDVGAAMALTAFLATVAFARYAERRGAGRPPREPGAAGEEAGNE